MQYTEPIEMDHSYPKYSKYFSKRLIRSIVILIALAEYAHYVTLIAFTWVCQTTATDVEIYYVHVKIVSVQQCSLRSFSSAVK